MQDLDYLYAHHAVGLCPEERCVTARANLAALVEERDRLRKALEGMNEPLQWVVDNYPRAMIAMPSHLFNRFDVAALALQGRVASREGSGTP